jgi:hypothetical protein
MSNWWDIDFSVIGPELAGEQHQFTEKTMAEMRFDDGAKLFHHVKIVASVPGYRAIHASRNHSGGPAIEELITRFPKLTFSGVLHTDNMYEHYTLFHGRGGQAMFTEHVVPENQMSIDEDHVDWLARVMNDAQSDHEPQPDLRPDWVEDWEQEFEFSDPETRAAFLRCRYFGACGDV